jgi:uncharacterized double-CXXCG motif protein
MYKTFSISPDDKKWGHLHPYVINAGRECCMPGLICKICGSTWSRTGIIYPTLNCSKLESIVKYMKPNPVSIDLYKFIYSELIELIGKKIVISPGTQFGPLIGKGKGDMGDFTWLNPWTPLVKGSVLNELRSEGIELCFEQARIQFSKKVKEAYFELEAHPQAKMLIDNVEDTWQCPVCGRSTLKMPKSLTIAHSSYDDSVSVQRCFEFPTILLVNERLAGAMRELKLTNVLIEEIAMR